MLGKPIVTAYLLSYRCHPIISKLFEAVPDVRSVLCCSVCPFIHRAQYPCTLSRQTLTTLLTHDEKLNSDSLRAVMMFPHNRTVTYLPETNCNVKSVKHNCQRWCSMLQQHANAARASCILGVQKTRHKTCTTNANGQPITHNFHTPIWLLV
ncbi:TPA: hypothetical protein ACH3X1_015057 [Trebouxia sp. C0004]